MSTDKFESILNTLVIPQDKIIKSEYSDALSNAILEICPSTLFRYRSCNERNIAAFDEDLIYAVTPNKFNDVYDTLPYYNINQFQKHNFSELIGRMQSFISENEGIYFILIHKGYNKKELSNIKYIATQNKKRFLSLLNDLIDFYFTDIQDIIRKSTHIVCFSEVIDSVIMWSHYAQNHEGFALEYNLKPILTDIQNDNKLLMPVIYKDKRYDATSFFLEAISKILKVSISTLNIMTIINTILYKSKSWEYEKEWRLILTEHSKEEVMSIPFKPKAIYYGARISKIHRKILHNIAKEKGLEEYDMSVNNTSNEYKMEYVKA